MLLSDSQASATLSGLLFPQAVSFSTPGSRMSEFSQLFWGYQEPARLGPLMTLILFSGGFSSVVLAVWDLFKLLSQAGQPWACLQVLTIQLCSGAGLSESGSPRGSVGGSHCLERVLKKRILLMSRDKGEPPLERVSCPHPSSWLLYCEVSN